MAGEGREAGSVVRERVETTFYLGSPACTGGFWGALALPHRFFFFSSLIELPPPKGLPCACITPRPLQTRLRAGEGWGRPGSELAQGLQVQSMTRSHAGPACSTMAYSPSPIGHSAAAQVLEPIDFFVAAGRRKAVRSRGRLLTDQHEVATRSPFWIPTTSATGWSASDSNNGDVRRLCIPPPSLPQFFTCSTFLPSPTV